jgi:transposase
VSPLWADRMVGHAVHDVVSDLFPESLWERLAPLLPPQRHRFRGRKPVEDRVAPAAIVFVLKTGITWNQLSADVILSSGVISTA